MPVCLSVCLSVCMACRLYGLTGKIIFSQPWPNLREFNFNLSYHRGQFDLFTKEEVERKFRDFNVSGIEQVSRGTPRFGPDHLVSGFLEMPQHFPQGSICKFYTDQFADANISVTIPSTGSNTSQINICFIAVVIKVYPCSSREGG